MSCKLFYYFTFTAAFTPWHCPFISTSVTEFPHFYKKQTWSWWIKRLKSGNINTPSKSNGWCIWGHVCDNTVWWQHSIVSSQYFHLCLLNKKSFPVRDWHQKLPCMSDVSKELRMLIYQNIQLLQLSYKSNPVNVILPIPLFEKSDKCMELVNWYMTYITN